MRACRSIVGLYPRQDTVAEPVGLVVVGRCGGGLKEKTFKPRENLFLSEQHDMLLRSILEARAAALLIHKNQPTESVVNSTQIRALSAEILLAFQEEWDCEFSGEAMHKVDTVGDAIRRLMDSNRRQTSKISLANSAQNYWLKPVKVS
jgi:hypothetical protein